MDSSLPTYFGRLYQLHDGQLDITNAANYVIASWNRFVDHDKVMLIGSSDSSTSDRGKLKVTLHHNVFDNAGQRAPRVRYGQVHIFNNLYRIKGGANYQYSWGVGIDSAIYANDDVFRVDEGIDPASFIGVYKGKAIVTLDTLSTPRPRTTASTCGPPTTRQTTRISRTPSGGRPGSSSAWIPSDCRR